jgi:hypothetical protein
MQLRSFTLLAMAALAAGQGAQAMSFGRPPSSVLLGSPLNFAVPVRLDPSESLSPECVAADVQIGDRKLLPGDWRVRLEPSGEPNERIVRVSGGMAVDEPVLAVTVHVGCTGRISRRFVTLVDPPSSTTVAPPVVAQDTGTEPAQSQAVASAGAPRSVELPAQARGAAPSERTPARPRRERAQQAAQAPTGSATRAPRTQPVARSAPPQLAKAPAGMLTETAEDLGRPLNRKPPRSSATPARAAAVAVVPTGAARLRLEAEDPAFFPPRRPDAASGAAGGQADAAAQSAAQTAAQNAAAALAGVEAASAAARVRALEGAVDELRKEIKANRDLMAQMRSRVSEGEWATKAAPWMGAGLALLAALALWLAWSLRRARAEQQHWWEAATHQAATSATPSEAPAAPSSQAAAVAAPAAAAAAAAAAPMFASKSAPAAAAAVVATSPAAVPGEAPELARVTDSSVFDTEVLRGMSGVQRDVAIDELIDLEQQADFFVALGQDDAAVDLLVGHIRGSGGTSPMAYLKLLEIYRRKGDAENYERTRTRFNHRFNGFAPDWDSGMQSGRSLEDYPQVMQRLQAVWPDALDAMAELEALMFRRGGGGELFELPAYRDLLFLYSLARDILDREGGRPAGVDLLLPLGNDPMLDHHLGFDASVFSPTDFGGAVLGGPEPAPLSSAGSAPVRAEPAVFTLDAAPGGLDLNLASGPAPLGEPGPAPAARVLDSHEIDFSLNDLPPVPPASPRK